MVKFKLELLCPSSHQKEPRQGTRVCCLSLDLHGCYAS